MSSHRLPPSVCPNCGEDVPPSALACPECGADYETGWKGLGEAESPELPEDAFDYDEAVGREFGDDLGREVKPESVRWIWWATGIAIVLVFIYGALRAVL
jgi:hypothetical protein